MSAVSFIFQQSQCFPTFPKNQMQNKSLKSSEATAEEHTPPDVYIHLLSQ